MSDTINRQDAIDAMESKNNVITEDDYHYCEDCDHIEMCRWYPLYGCEFRSRPSAKRKGKWIRHTRVEPVYSIDGVKTWGIKCQCNQCSFATTVVEDFGYYKYCPNCGARMVSEDD